MPRISIITPTYNRAAYLLRAIRSVQCQTMGDYEHIVVDDGSGDDTIDRVQAIKDDRIVVIPLDKNKGANFARNLGLGIAKSPLVTFLDSDDVFKPTRLRGVVDLFDREPRLNAMISSFETIRGNKTRNSRNPERSLSQKMLEKALAFNAICIAGSAISIRRETAKVAGGFTEHLNRLQDRDFLLKVSRISGAKLLSNVDWIKHESDDSISAPISGYVSAFGALLEEHPNLKRDYSEFTGYHAARSIVRAFLRGQVSTGLSEYRANRNCNGLNLSLRELADGYSKGKSVRREFVRSLL